MSKQIESARARHCKKQSLLKTTLWRSEENKVLNTPEDAFGVSGLPGAEIQPEQNVEMTDQVMANSETNKKTSMGCSEKHSQGTTIIQAQEVVEVASTFNAAVPIEASTKNDWIDGNAIMTLIFYFALALMSQDFLIVNFINVGNNYIRTLPLLTPRNY